MSLAQKEWKKGEGGSGESFLLKWMEERRKQIGGTKRKFPNNSKLFVSLYFGNTLRLYFGHFSSQAN